MTSNGDGAARQINHHDRNECISIEQGLSVFLTAFKSRTYLNDVLTRFIYLPTHSYSVGFEFRYVSAALHIKINGNTFWVGKQAGRPSGNLLASRIDIEWHLSS